MRIAKWLTALLIAPPILYVASFGPACWAARAGWLPLRPTVHIFWPCIEAACPFFSEETCFSRPLHAYACLFDRKDENDTIMDIRISLIVHHE